MPRVLKKTNESTAPNPVLSNLPIMIEQKKVKNFDNSDTHERVMTTPKQYKHSPSPVPNFLKFLFIHLKA